MDIIADIERDHPGLAHVMHLDREPAPSGPQPARTHSQALLSALQHVQVIKASLEAHVRSIDAKVGRYLPLLERIVSDPFLDGLLEKLLEARRLGVPAEVLGAVEDVLDAAIGRTLPALPASDADSGVAPSGGTPPARPAEAPGSGELAPGGQPDAPGAAEAVSEPPAEGSQS